MNVCLSLLAIASGAALGAWTRWGLNARSYFDKELADLQACANAAGVTPHTQIRVGRPAEQIIAAAEGWAADLIVTGHRGKGLFERWLLGSVSRLVITYAGCAVMVIR